MANFVLLHGAWHWGGCFSKHANELLLRGHNVAMPDLASHGFDATPVGAVKDMAQYTAPARRLIEASSEKVILLGHSMGGVSCTYLGEKMAEKISTLVYLAAMLTPDGKSVNDYYAPGASEASPRSAALARLVSPAPDGLRLDARDAALLKAAFYGDCSDHDVAIAMKNSIPVQTPVTAAELARTTPERYGRLRRVYIECTEDAAITIAFQRRMQAEVPGTEVVTMATSHSPFFSAPEPLADILARLI